MKDKDKGATSPILETDLLTPKEAAALLKLSESFLAKARMRGDGPRFRKLSRSVRYARTDLSLWVKACAKTSTTECKSLGVDSQSCRMKFLHRRANRRNPSRD
jgi:hypothetical protein